MGLYVSPIFNLHAHVVVVADLWSGRSSIPIGGVESLTASREENFFFLVARISPWLRVGSGQMALTLCRSDVGISARRKPEEKAV